MSSASVLFITALLEVSTVSSWSSAAMIYLLAIPDLLWMGFVVWKWFFWKQEGHSRTSVSSNFVEQSVVDGNHISIFIRLILLEL